MQSPAVEEAKRKGRVEQGNQGSAVYSFAYEFSVIAEKGVTTSDRVLPVPSTTPWCTETGGKRFSGMIEIDGSFWAISLKAHSATGAKCNCYVLHLFGMTPEGNLSQWMHQLKTAYTLYFTSIAGIW
jgi:hypothetical protein